MTGAHTEWAVTWCNRKLGQATLARWIKDEKVVICRSGELRSQKAAGSRSSPALTSCSFHCHLILPAPPQCPERNVLFFFLSLPSSHKGVYLFSSAFCPLRWVGRATGGLHGDGSPLVSAVFLKSDTKMGEYGWPAMTGVLLHYTVHTVHTVHTHTHTTHTHTTHTHTHAPTHFHTYTRGSASLIKEPWEAWVTVGAVEVCQCVSGGLSDCRSPVP